VTEVSLAPFDLFAERLTAAGGHAHRVAGSEDAAGIVAGLGGSRTAWISRELAERAPGLVRAFGQQGIEARVPASPDDTRDQPLGIAIAEAAIAETGSSVMSEPAVASRSVSLVTNTLVIVCPAKRLVPSLDEAAGILREIGSGGASYATFITGPSRTADIERQLTVGVQGPGVLHVILVDNLA
jgi:L-lactate dehydrogenase complex protein LldG